MKKRFSSFCVLICTTLSLLVPLPVHASLIEAWVRRFNEGSSDRVVGVVIDKNGNVAITGISGNWGPPNGADQYSAKYASTNGALIWEKRFSGQENHGVGARAIALDTDGNVAVAGALLGSEETYFDYYVAKYAAADGTLLWEKRYNGPASYADEPQAIVFDQHGDVIVTGYSDSRTETDLNPDFYTAKYAGLDGALIWERRYDSPDHTDDRAVAVAVDSNGNVVVAGNSFVIGEGFDYYTIKYSGTDGKTLWEKRYQGSGASMDYLKNLAIDHNDDVVVTGYSRSTDSTNFYTAKYSAPDGTLLWEARYNEGEASALAIDKNGNVVVTGFAGTADFPWRPLVTEYYVTKYASLNGAVIWAERHFGPYGRGAKAEAVAVGDDGNVIVTGNVAGWGVYTVEYASTNGSNSLTNGSILCEKTFETFDKNSVSVYGPRCLALGPNGSVSVSGTANNNSEEILTVLYKGSDVDRPVISIEMIPRLRFTGSAGCRYEIQRAATPTGPWEVIGFIVAPPGGDMEYIDTSVTSGAYFYRVSSL